MTMRVIKKRRFPDRLVVAVHVDTSKVDGQGNPDPAYVVEREWSRTNPLGGSTAAWLVSIEGEMRATAQSFLARRGDNDAQGTAMAGEGADL